MNRKLLVGVLVLALVCVGAVAGQDADICAVWAKYIDSAQERTAFRAECPNTPIFEPTKIPDPSNWKSTESQYDRLNGYYWMQLHLKADKADYPYASISLGAVSSCSVRRWRAATSIRAR